MPTKKNEKLSHEHRSGGEATPFSANTFAGDFLARRHGRLPSQGHDLAPDGKHFVAILESAAPGESKSVSVLLNFFDELRRRVPGGAKH
jgi:hypothetical protein